jgi:hypothetical protein
VYRASTALIAGERAALAALKARAASDSRQRRAKQLNLCHRTRYGPRPPGPWWGGLRRWRPCSEQGGYCSARPGSLALAARGHAIYIQSRRRMPAACFTRNDPTHPSGCTLTALRRHAPRRRLGLAGTRWTQGAWQPTWQQAAAAAMSSSRWPQRWGGDGPSMARVQHRLSASPPQPRHEGAGSCTPCAGHSDTPFLAYGPQVVTACLACLHAAAGAAAASTDDAGSQGDQTANACARLVVSGGHTCGSGLVAAGVPAARQAPRSQSQPATRAVPANLPIHTPCAPVVLCRRYASSRSPHARTWRTHAVRTCSSSSSSSRPRCRRYALQLSAALRARACGSRTRCWCSPILGPIWWSPAATRRRQRLRRPG